MPDVTTPQDKLRIEANHHKARNHAKGALLRRMRERLMPIADDIQDEGDRAYFGSTNDADDLQSFVREMTNWRWDDVLSKDEGLTDPYAMLREQRARADKAEAQVARLQQRPTFQLQWECIKPDYLYVAPAPLFGSIRVERYLHSDPWNADWSVPGFRNTLLPGDFPTAEAAMKAVDDHVALILFPEAPDAR